MINQTDILIIDDEEVILDAISKVAVMEGYTTSICQKVNDALKNLENNTYRLIICDIMMPEIDGFELLNIIRSRKINTPIVITSGYSTFENAVKALYEGAVGFIPKPFSVDELTSIIHRGIRYGNIFKKHYESGFRNSNEILDFIPCPPKYYRLGYDSWMNSAEEGLVKIGLTDLFLKSIGNVKQIEFMMIEESVYQGGICLKVLDNTDSCHQLLSPVTGKIIDINEKLITNHSLLEKDPYFLGWIYKMLPNNLDIELKTITPCSTDI